MQNANVEVHEKWFINSQIEKAMNNKEWMRERNREGEGEQARKETEKKRYRKREGARGCRKCAKTNRYMHKQYNWMNVMKSTFFAENPKGKHENDTNL